MEDPPPPLSYLPKSCILSDFTIISNLKSDRVSHAYLFPCCSKFGPMSPAAPPRPLSPDARVSCFRGWFVVVERWMVLLCRAGDNTLLKPKALWGSFLKHCLLAWQPSVSSPQLLQDLSLCWKFSNIKKPLCCALNFQLLWVEDNSPPSGFEQKKHQKKMPLSEKKNTIWQKKRAIFGIISFLKRVFCLPLLHKISPFNVFKTINYLFFNISKTSYFTKQQTHLMIIISHNFKEMIFFIRID